MRTPSLVPKKDRLDARTCERCGKLITIEQKCFLKTSQNREHPVKIHTSAKGEVYRIKKPPSQLTRVSVGLCPDCLKQAEELIIRFREEIV